MREADKWEMGNDEWKSGKVSLASSYGGREGSQWWEVIDGDQCVCTT